MGKITHFMYVPFTGLGLYNGHRGKRWLRNRIQVFKQFVVPSLMAQTEQNFKLWISWRYEDRKDPMIKKLKEYLDPIFDTTFTYSGVCFYDDKYKKDEAIDRLSQAIQGSVGVLADAIGDADYVYMTIQPSDDCYHKEAVKEIQSALYGTKVQAVGFSKGYMMNYPTGDIAEYNPSTNPPFYTIKFTKEVFMNPLRHMGHTALKYDVDKYAKGTPLPSHEYVKDCLKYGIIHERGFLVGTHGENISTVFNHPFRGEAVSPDVKSNFGLEHAGLLKIRTSLRKILFRKLPHKVQRKLRYLVGERLFQKFYDFMRS